MTLKEDIAKMIYAVNRQQHDMAVHWNDWNILDEKYHETFYQQAEAILQLPYFQDVQRLVEAARELSVYLPEEIEQYELEIALVPFTGENQ